jgi:hypothetical protein
MKQSFPVDDSTVMPLAAVSRTGDVVYPKDLHVGTCCNHAAMMQYCITDDIHDRNGTRLQDTCISPFCDAATDLGSTAELLHEFKQSYHAAGDTG